MFPESEASSEQETPAEPRLVTHNSASNHSRPRAALYLRVSTRADKRDGDDATQRKRQEVDNQRRQLRRFCEQQGWEIVDEYIDEESGAKSDRSGFLRMWQDARQRKFDVLLFWALDRFSREGVLETLNYLQRLTSYRINWRSHTEQYLDSTGIFREAVIAILAAIAKQERVRMGERTRAGLDRAREKGTRSGNPIGRPRVILSRDRVMELRKEGHSWREIAIRLHASIAAVRRVHKEETARSGACRKGGTEIRHV